VNKDEMNRAIAEIHGYELKPLPQNPAQKTWQRYGCTQLLPDYVSDLNAIQSAICSVLNHADSPTNWRFCEILCEVVGCGPNIVTALVCALPEQRAEAFLRTLSLYQDTRES
jgi:hypothetical protein